MIAQELTPIDSSASANSLERDAYIGRAEVRPRGRLHLQGFTECVIALPIYIQEHGACTHHAVARR